MAQIHTFTDSDTTEVNFSEVDDNEYFKYDTERYVKLKSSLGASYSCMDLEDGAGKNFNATDKVKKYTSIEFIFTKTN